MELGLERQLALSLDQLLERKHYQHHHQHANSNNQLRTNQTKSSPMLMVKKPHSTTRKRALKPESATSLKPTPTTGMAVALRKQSLKKRKRSTIKPTRVNATREHSNLTRTALVRQQNADPKNGQRAVPAHIHKHFATHPTRFVLPQGIKLRITVDLGDVPAIVGKEQIDIKQEPLGV